MGLFVRSLNKITYIWRHQSLVFWHILHVSGHTLHLVSWHISLSVCDIHAKSPYKETHIRQKETHIHQKETHIHQKETRRRECIYVSCLLTYILVVNLSFFKAITSLNRMAEKKDGKGKRSQCTQNTPATRNLAVLELRVWVWVWKTNAQYNFESIPDINVYNYRTLHDL